MKPEEFAACAPEAVLNQPSALENYILYEGAPCQTSALQDSLTSDEPGL
jgi:hypothetical protein